MPKMSNAVTGTSRFPRENKGSERQGGALADQNAQDGSPKCPRCQTELPERLVSLSRKWPKQEVAADLLPSRLTHSPQLLMSGHLISVLVMFSGGALRASVLGSGCLWGEGPPCTDNSEHFNQWVLGDPPHVNPYSAGSTRKKTTTGPDVAPTTTGRPMVYPT